MIRAMRPHLVRLGLAGAAGALAELCALGLVASAAWMIARAAEQPSLAALGLAIVAVRGCAVLKGVFRYAERLAGHDAALRALAQLRVRVFDALARRREPVRDGDALMRMVSDVDGIQDLLLRCLLPATGALTAAIAATGFATIVRPSAGAALAAGLLVAGALVPAAVLIVTRRTGAQVHGQRDKLAAASLDLLEGADDLAAFGATDRARTVAAEASARLARLERRAAAVSAAAATAGIIVQTLTALGVLLAARPAGTVTASMLTLTTLVAVEAVLPLAAAAQHLAAALPAARRVSALLAKPQEAKAAKSLSLPRGPLAVELLGVSVSYSGRPALRGVDVQIRRGGRVAIVGASGAGKSTLLAVVTGEVPVDGAVTLAGSELSMYAPDEVRRAVRGLAQDAHIFTATIRANLVLARPEATEAELVAAARRAHILDFIEGLPGRWDTEVAPDTLSGGQRQRLLLARALLADPQVLLLDEPGEGLDTETADAITRDLLSSAGGGTLLLVTHRLAGLHLADEILVMDEGRIAQRGTHAVLSACPGPYRDLLEAELLTSA